MMKPSRLSGDNLPKATSTSTSSNSPPPSPPSSSSSSSASIDNNGVSKKKKASSKTFLPLFKRRKSVVDELDVSEKNKSHQIDNHNGSPSPKHHATNATSSSPSPPHHNHNHNDDMHATKSHSSSSLNLNCMAGNEGKEKEMKPSSSSSSSVGLAHRPHLIQEMQAAASSSTGSITLGNGSGSNSPRQDSYAFLAELLNHQRGEEAEIIFGKHCHKNYCSELLDCYHAINQYRDPHSTPDDHLLVMGKKIYDRFLRRGANEEVNTPTEVVDQIMEAIKTRSMQRNTFDPVIMEIRPLLLQQLLLLQTGPERDHFLKVSL